MLRQILVAIVFPAIVRRTRRDRGLPGRAQRLSSPMPSERHHGSCVRVVKGHREHGPCPATRSGLRPFPCTRLPSANAHRALLGTWATGPSGGEMDRAPPTCWAQIRSSYRRWPGQDGRMGGVFVVYEQSHPTTGHLDSLHRFSSLPRDAIERGVRGPHTVLAR